MTYELEEDIDENEPIDLPRGWAAINPARGVSMQTVASRPPPASDATPGATPNGPTGDRLDPPRCPPCPTCPPARRAGRVQGEPSLLGLLLGVGLLGGVVYYGGMQLAQAAVSGMGEDEDEDGDEPELEALPMGMIEATVVEEEDEEFDGIEDLADLAMDEEEG